MSADPTLVPADALTGRRIGFSVSESRDLPVLGLDPAHIELVVAELTRAILYAGGVIVYGGWIDGGFTEVVVSEVDRYGMPKAFEHYVPYTVHIEHSSEQLRRYHSRLSERSTVWLLDPDGKRYRVPDWLSEKRSRRRADAASRAKALTSLRDLLADNTDARIIVGGKVAGFGGRLPGVAEEAGVMLSQSKPVLVAGGFGGAATLVGQLLSPAHYDWAPPGLPAGLTEEVRQGWRTCSRMPASPSRTG